MSGYPDVPFRVPEDAPIYHDLVEAKYLTTYLEDYVTGHEYDGRSLSERFIFDCSVTRVRKEDNIWIVQAKLHGQEISYAAKKIIIATGMTSDPLMPELPGKEAFSGPLLHQKEFGRSKIITASEPNMEKHTHVTVIGGSKSASDIAYAAAKDTNQPRKVNWIIRNSGGGPLILADAKAFGKYKVSSELGTIRALASLSAANPYLPESWWSWFTHKTWVGESLLSWVWNQVPNQAKALANYEGREGALPGFEKLVPSASIRWRSGPMGMHQKDDFWDTIAKNVQVYRGEVQRLEDNAVILDDGTKVETDMLLCATGWKQEHSYFEDDEAAGLGLPVSLKNEANAKGLRREWSLLDEEADGEVLSRWPYLASVPKFNAPPPHTTPYRLYNMTIPPNDTSIAFLGYQHVPNSYHTSVVQTLYAIAVLDGALKLPSKDEINKSVAFIDRWCARRYPVHGWLGNVLDYEMVSFTDHLLDQLGLSSHRRMDSWWGDLTNPCLASDYAGLVDEYRRKHATTVV
jgi:cation diffusion facilitator CzcD-associated flavoprotein CzcO